MTHSTKWEIIESEIEKCQVLCANCHQKKTCTDKQWSKANFLKDKGML